MTKNDVQNVHCQPAHKLTNDDVSLPDSVISVDSITTFRRHLKHYLFQKSYPDVIL